MSKAEVVRKYGVEEPRLIQYDSYETMVNSIKEELNTTEKLILRVRWFVGCQAYILMENRKYGDHTVEEFAADLELSPSSIYEARRFYITYTKEELDQRLIDRQFTYRRALAMTRCKDADQRQIIEDAAYEQQLTDEEIDDLVKAANGGMKLPDTPEEVKKVVDELTRNRDQVKSVKDGVDDENAEEEYDADDSNAVKAVGSEDAVLKKIRNASGDAERACTVITAAVTKLTEELPNLSLLSEEGYVLAEKSLMDVLGAMKSATLVLYNAQKTFTANNIVIRG